VATFYKKKDEVSLRPGQTLGYTAGKGYYAAGTPTPSKPPPAAAAPAKQASAAPTVTRPVAAKMPTAPERVGSKPTIVSPTSEAADLAGEEAERSDARAGRSPSSAIPKLSESTAHYEHGGDVPIKPGQTLAFAAERGYYAAGRPNPEKASTTPTSSTTKITALSTRGSTESPLKEHVETRDGRTTVTLSHASKPAAEKTSQERKVSAHANEGSAKPSGKPARRTAKRPTKASSRVHEQLANTKRRRDARKPPQRHKRDNNHPLTALAASASLANLFGEGYSSRPPLRPGMKRGKGVIFALPDFVGETTVEASITGVTAEESDGRIVVNAGNNLPLFSLSLGPLAGFVQSVSGEIATINQNLTNTVAVPGVGTVTSTCTPTGVVTTVTRKLSRPVRRFVVVFSERRPPSRRPVY
jgi:hypothetical protein